METFLPFGQPQGIRFPGEIDGITVGPVIGLITDHSVRILVETNYTGTLTPTLTGRDYVAADREVATHQVIGKTYEVTEGRPITIEIKDLKPRYTYSVDFDKPFFDLVHSGFTTLTQDKLDTNPLKIAVVNGNDVHYYADRIPKVNRYAGGLTLTRKTHHTADSLWKDLYNRITAEDIKIVIHAGNNVRMDGPDTPFGQLLKSGEYTVDEATDAFRSAYRTTWNEPWLKHVLANVSNIMIADETDIGRMVTTGSDESNETCWELAEIAFRTYREYQHSLVTGRTAMDVGTSEAGTMTPPSGGSFASVSSMGSTAVEDLDDPDDESNLFNLVTTKLTDEVGLVLFDWRSIATFGAHGDEHLHHRVASSAQKKKLKKALKKKFNDVSALLFVSPTNFCIEKSFLRQPTHDKDLKDVLRILGKWKVHKPVNVREVLMVTNAMRSQTWRSDDADWSLHQRTPLGKHCLFGFGVGPINRPVSGAAGWLRTLEKHITEYAGGHFSKTDIHAENAYGIITVGSKITQTDVPSYGHYEDGRFLVNRPVFWMQKVTTKWSKDAKDLEATKIGESSCADLLPARASNCTFDPKHRF